jgi:hypothetical protein
METEATQTTETVAATEATTEDANGNPQSETSYLDGKYKSVSDLEKGYKELQSSYSKKLGAFTGAPEEYVLPDGIEADGRIEALTKWGKENQLNNDALNSVISIDSEYRNAQRDAYAQEQRELLGKDADSRLNNIQDWARANLGEDAMDEFSGLITSAKSVEIFEKLSRLSLGTSPAPIAAKQSLDKDTINQMRFAKDEFGNRKMSSDPEYRAKVEAMEAELYGR